MSIKSDNHALKALAEEVRADTDMLTINMYGRITPEKLGMMRGPRIQDGASYFHGVYTDEVR